MSGLKFFLFVFIESVFPITVFHVMKEALSATMTEKKSILYSGLTAFTFVWIVAGVFMYHTLRGKKKEMKQKKEE